MPLKHFAYFGDLFAREPFTLCKRSQKRRQRALEVILHKAFALAGIELLPAYTRGDLSLLVLENPLFTEPFQNRVGGALLPAEDFIAFLCQLGGGDRLVLPYYVGESCFSLAPLVVVQIISPILAFEVLF